jgi:NCS1 nucleoside transporter family
MPGIENNKEVVFANDLEKGAIEPSVNVTTSEEASVQEVNKKRFWSKLYDNGVEFHGGAPIPLKEQNDTRYFNVFTVYSTSLTSLLPIGSGLVPTLFYGLSLRDAFLIIFFFSFLFTAPAAYMMTISPRTGMRQMVQGRFSFGYYLNSIQVLITMLTVAGFGVIAASIGAQCLTSLSKGKVNEQGSLALILVPAMCIAFSGYRVLHFYQRFAWIPVLFALFVLVGYSHKELGNQTPTEPITARAFFNTVAFMAGYLISWGNVAGDYCVYMPPNSPKIRIFFYGLFGICTPAILLLTFGSAIGAAIVNNPHWLSEYHKYSTGGILGAMLEPAGGFGKFILVILTFSVLGTCSREIYTIANDFQILIPKAHIIPRIIWVIVSGGLILGIAIGAVGHFYTGLVNLIYFIGYFSTSYVAVILLEWWWFRKADPKSYDHSIWDSPRELPWGIAATLTVFLPWALVVPCMDETWYTGPFAKKTGDLGFEVAGILSCILYIPLRMLEIKLSGRRR